MDSKTTGNTHEGYRNVDNIGENSKGLYRRGVRAAADYRTRQVLCMNRDSRRSGGGMAQLFLASLTDAACGVRVQDGLANLSLAGNTEVQRAVIQPLERAPELQYMGIALEGQKRIEFMMREFSFEK
jgi:hypothetical protein